MKYLLLQLKINENLLHYRSKFRHLKTFREILRGFLLLTKAFIQIVYDNTVLCKPYVSKQMILDKHIS